VDIRFQSAKARSDAGLAAYARQCLLRQMQHRGDRVDRIDVGFVDAAGRMPPRDSYCIVRMKLHGLPAASVVVVGSDVQTAIGRAADRVGRLADEQLRQSAGPPATPAATLAA